MTEIVKKGQDLKNEQPALLVIVGQQFNWSYVASKDLDCGTCAFGKGVLTL